MLYLTNAPPVLDVWTGGFLIAVAATMVAALSYFITWLALPRGPLAALAVAFCCGLAFGAGGFALGVAVSDFPPLPYMGAIAGFALAVPSGGICVLGASRWIFSDLSLARTAQTFAIANFGVLDIDGDGLINRGDLERAAELPNWTASQRYIIEYMLRNWPDIGHEIGTAEDVIFTGMPISAGMTGAVPVTFRILAISLDDLRTFPDRLRNKWRNWL